MRAGYKVENGSEVFETQFSRKPVDNSLKGGIKEAVSTVADVVSIFPGGSTEGKLLAQTSKSQTSRAVKAATSDISVTDTKNALNQVYEKLGIDKALPKMKEGKYGSSQRGDSNKGYRLDKEGHPNTTNPNETGPHINYWDYTQGKRKSGNGIKDAVPIKK